MECVKEFRVRGRPETKHSEIFGNGASDPCQCSFCFDLLSLSRRTGFLCSLTHVVEFCFQKFPSFLYIAMQALRGKLPFTNFQTHRKCIGCPCLSHENVSGHCV